MAKPAPQPSVASAVMEAARRRAAALAAGDVAGLGALLHPDFRWTSHLGESLDREAYLRSNTGGTNRWSGQHLDEVEVLVVGETAVLRCLVEDTVDRGEGAQVFRMPMTQVWVPYAGAWVCLAGHAGPRLDPR